MLVMLVGVTRMKTETLPGNIYLNVSTNQIDGALASAWLPRRLAGFSLFISHLVTKQLLTIQTLNLTRGTFQLKDISFSVYSNEILAIIGKTGSGKTLHMD